MTSNGLQVNGYQDSTTYVDSTKKSQDPVNQEFEEIQIPVPWGNIAGKWWGQKDNQPVLALHGWQDNAGTFDNLAPLLVAQNISLLCIDLPGHGFSSHIPKGMCYYVVWDGVQVVRRIAKYYNWEKITIMGHSLGGAIAFLYAAIFPNDISKYISIDIASPVTREIPKMLSLLGSGIDRFLKFEKLKPESQPCYDYDEMLGIVEDAYKGGCTHESCKILMRRGMQIHQADSSYEEEQTYFFSRDIRLKVPAWSMMNHQQALEFASAITCEVLNIRAQDGLVFDRPNDYQEIIDKIRESAKRLEFVEVPGTHHLHLNNPERISDIIVEFLKT